MLNKKLEQRVLELEKRIIVNDQSLNRYCEFRIAAVLEEVKLLADALGLVRVDRAFHGYEKKGGPEQP